MITPPGIAAEDDGAGLVSWSAPQRHHHGEDGDHSRRGQKGFRLSPADLAVRACGHAEQQSESYELAHDRAVNEQSAETGSQDETAGGETQHRFHRRRPFSRAADERMPEGERDPDGDAASITAAGQTKSSSIGISLPVAGSAWVNAISRQLPQAHGPEGLLA
ncbi:MAG: hypothetical protein GY745_18920 [Actinomycetia bacterium]|nr:hypothetical protein [Actinomycetes bacterium]